MRRDIEISAGDICGDATGLRVRVEEVDLYDYVHFSVVEKSESKEDDGDWRDVASCFRSPIYKNGTLHLLRRTGFRARSIRTRLGARSEISVGNVLDVAEFVGDRGWKTFLQTTSPATLAILSLLAEKAK